MISENVSEGSELQATSVSACNIAALPSGVNLSEISGAVSKSDVI